MKLGIGGFAMGTFFLTVTVVKGQQDSEMETFLQFLLPKFKDWADLKGLELEPSSWNEPFQTPYVSEDLDFVAEYSNQTISGWTDMELDRILTENITDGGRFCFRARTGYEVRGDFRIQGQFHLPQVPIEGQGRFKINLGCRPVLRMELCFSNIRIRDDHLDLCEAVAEVTTRPRLTSIDLSLFESERLPESEFLHSRTRIVDAMGAVYEDQVDLGLLVDHMKNAMKEKCLTFIPYQKLHLWTWIHKLLIFKQVFDIDVHLTLKCVC